MVALERAGIEVDRYYASEIDNKAIKVSQNHYPNITQLGNVENWENWNIAWSEIDLIIGGSPCQGFSTSGKMLNFNDSRSKLFFKYVEILNHIKLFNPNVRFLLENVKMKKEWADIISNNLGVEYIEINSDQVSAQNRVRQYWFNWKAEELKNKNIMLTDILEDCTYFNSAAIRTRPIVSERYRKSLCLEVNDRNKALCLLTVNLNNIVSSLPKGRYKDIHVNNYPYRNYTSVEMCRLQTLPDNYVKDMNLTDSAKLLGNAWTVDVIAHIFKNIK